MRHNVARILVGNKKRTGLALSGSMVRSDISDKSDGEPGLADSIYESDAPDEFHA